MSGLGLLIAGIASLVAWFIPGRTGRIASQAIYICLLIYIVILLNYGWLSPFWMGLFPPAH